MLCKAISKCHGTNDTAISTMEQEIANCPSWNKRHWDTHYRTKQCTSQYPLQNKTMQPKIPTAQQNNAPQNTHCTTKECTPKYPLHNKPMHSRIPTAQQKSAPQNTHCTTKQCTPKYPLHNKTMHPKIPTAQQTPQYPLHNKSHPDTRCRTKHTLQQKKTQEGKTPRYPN